MKVWLGVCAFALIFIFQSCLAQDCPNNYNCGTDFQNCLNTMWVCDCYYNYSVCTYQSNCINDEYTNCVDDGCELEYCEWDYVSTTAYPYSSAYYGTSTPTPPSPSVQSGSSFVNFSILIIIFLGVLMALVFILIILVIVLICIIGCRRKSCANRNQYQPIQNEISMPINNSPFSPVQSSAALPPPPPYGYNNYQSTR